MYGFDSSFSSSFVSVLECIIQNHFPPFLWSIILLFCWKAKENYSLKTKAIYTISKPPRKLLFDGCDTWLWGSPKNFLLVSSTQHVYLQASLGSYLSAKTNGSITRHSNRILQSKTWADGDFLVLILPEERIPLCVIFENMSKCVILMKCFHFKVL